MVITIASSDKLTLSMFSDFYKTLYDQDVLLLDLSCLYSSDILKAKIDEIVETSQNRSSVLIKYKIKVQTKELPLDLIEKSDVLIKFDIYSTEPEIVKSNGAATDLMLGRWKINILNLNKK